MRSPLFQAKMGMTDDFEASLQVLRGFDTDITQEVNEIKVHTFTHAYIHTYIYI